MLVHGYGTTSLIVLSGLDVRVVHCYLRYFAAFCLFFPSGLPVPFALSSSHVPNHAFLVLQSCRWFLCRSVCPLLLGFVLCFRFQFFLVTAPSLFLVCFGPAPFSCSRCSHATSLLSSCGLAYLFSHFAHFSLGWVLCITYPLHPQGSLFLASFFMSLCISDCPFCPPAWIPQFIPPHSVFVGTSIALIGTVLLLAFSFFFHVLSYAASAHPSGDTHPHLASALSRPP